MEKPAPPLAQYMASNDPSVLEAVRENARLEAKFFEDIKAWADEFGLDNAGFLRSHVGLDATDLPVKPENRGGWTKKSGWWRPFKNNTAEWERMERVSIKWVPVPGLPMHAYSGSTRDGSFMRMFPQPIEHDGRAWIGYPHLPIISERNGTMDPRWVEVLASEFRAAKAAKAPESMV